MPPKYKSRKRVTESDGEEEPMSKKTKSTFQPTSEAQHDAEGNEYWEISGARRIQISEFKGKRMINIREFYEKDGQQLPGKKGISLPIEQFSTLIQLLPQIEKALADKGEQVPRPEYGAAVAKKEDSDVKEEVDEDEDEIKSTKQNHESTSDEE